MTLLRRKRAIVADPAVHRRHAVGVSPRVLVGADDVTRGVRRGTTDPEPRLLAARRPGVDAAGCVVVEHAPAGPRPGREAGMATVALATTHRAEERDADLVVANPAALSALVTDAAMAISVRRRGPGRAVHRCPRCGQR